MEFKIVTDWTVELIRSWTAGEMRSNPEFLKGSVETLATGDHKLRLPNSLRSGPAPLGGHRFTGLSGALHQGFKRT